MRLRAAARPGGPPFSRETLFVSTRNVVTETISFC
jgi:hypothetical protein